MKGTAAICFALAAQGCGVFTSHQTARVLPYGRGSCQLSVDNVPRANFDGRKTGSDMRFGFGAGSGVELGARLAFGVGHGIDVKFQTSDEESGSLPISTSIGLSAMMFKFQDGEKDDFFSGTFTASRAFGPVEPYLAFRYQYLSSRDQPEAFREHTRHVFLGTRIQITSWLFAGIESSYVRGDKDDAFVVSGLIGFSFNTQASEEETKAEPK